MGLGIFHSLKKSLSGLKTLEEAKKILSLGTQTSKHQEIFDLRLSLESQCGLLQAMSYNTVLWPYD